MTVNIPWVAVTVFSINRCLFALTADCSIDQDISDYFIQLISVSLLLHQVKYQVAITAGYCISIASVSGNITCSPADISISPMAYKSGKGNY